MRRLVLLFVVLMASMAAQDKPVTPPPASPQPTVITYSAVEKAQIEQYESDNRAKVKQAKKLLKRAATLQAELTKVQQQLQALSNQTVSVQKR